METKTNNNEIFEEELKIIAEEIKKELLFLLEIAPYLVQALRLLYGASDSQQQEKK